MIFTETRKLRSFITSQKGRTSAQPMASNWSGRTTQKRLRHSPVRWIGKERLSYLCCLAELTKQARLSLGMMRARNCKAQPYTILLGECDYEHYEIRTRLLGCRRAGQKAHY